MGDSKRRKDLGCLVERRDAAQPQKEKARRLKEKVMRLASSEPVRSGFRPDLGRVLASAGCEHVLVKASVQSMTYSPLKAGKMTGAAVHVTPSVLSYSGYPDSPLYFGGIFILTVECLADIPTEILAHQYVRRKLEEGVTLRVGYDRAYRGKGSGEYVVPLMLDLEAIDD